MTCDVTQLSAKFESRGNPAAIGYDVGGSWSYGSYQIATKTGTMIDFLRYLNKFYHDLYLVLDEAGGNSAALHGLDSFKTAWKILASGSGASRFQQAQTDFIIFSHYNIAMETLLRAKIDFASRSCALKNSIFSLAVMAGPGKVVGNGRGACGLVYDAILALGGVQQLSKLSDAVLINQIYTGKLHRIDTGNEYHSVSDSIRASVRNRIVKEQALAIQMLQGEQSQTT